MLDLVLPFKKLTKKDVPIAGGKGAQLGEMFNAGIPVPDGFVVLTNAFNLFIQENSLEKSIQHELSKANHSSPESIENASKQIRKQILQAPVPKEIKKKALESFARLDAKFVAVRSSATVEDASAASWAGELDSYTNTGKKELIENIRKCWASLFTPRAIFYRIEHDMRDENVSVAVVVQKMVDSEISGVVFTANPVNQNRNQIVIEAGYGLGESIVAGKITPDNYVVDKYTKSIETIYIGKQVTRIVKKKGKSVEEKVPNEFQEKQKLKGKQIIQIAAICEKIEQHYGKPQDIEFAIAKEKIYIVQSRPITTLN